jgi:hypothetical protein
MLSLSEVENQVKDYLMGSQTAAEGYLPLSLIAPRVLISTISKIESQLRTHYPGFSISIKEPMHYFHGRYVLAAQSQTDILIQIAFPVSKIPAIFDVYHVTSIPLPITLDSNTALAQITNIPQYFAVARRNNFYVTLPESDISTCTGSNYRQCHYPFPIVPHGVPSCISGLFYKNDQYIKQKCHYKYNPNSQNIDRIFDLGNGTVIISGKHHDWRLVCPHTAPKHIPGCDICVRPLPCQCSIQSDTIYFAANTHCHDDLTSHESLTGLMVNDKMPRMYENIVPNWTDIAVTDINIYRHNWSTLNEDSELVLAIQGFNDKYRNINTNRIYYSPSDYLYDKMENMPRYIPFAWNLVVLVSLTILSITNFICILPFVYRMIHKCRLFRATSPRPDAPSLDIPMLSSLPTPQND